jgi:surface polysaccharide O-acyltransferase-like enzyme
MSRPWFKPWGWIYRPVAWPAFAVVVLGMIFSLQVFLAVDRASHSASDTLYGIFPFVVPCWMLVYWVASKTSTRQN